MKKIIVLSLFLTGFITLHAETRKDVFLAMPCVSDTTFEIYAGVYKLDENPLSATYTISFEGGKLYGKAEGYDKTELTKQTTAHAFKSGYGSDVVFSQEAAGKPFNRIKLVVQGNEVMGTKQ